MPGKYQETAPKVLITTIIALGICYAGYSSYIWFLTDAYPNEEITNFYSRMVLFLAVWFVFVEGRSKKDIVKSQVCAQAIWFTFPVYFPYYAFVTRGYRGLLCIPVLALFVFMEVFVSTIYIALYE